MGVAHVGAVVPDEAYGAPCELAVRINAYVLLLGDEASLEASFLEERECRHAVIYVAVDRLAEFEVFLAVSILDIASHAGDSLFAEVEGVGTVIGN